MPTNSKEYVEKNREKYWKNDKSREKSKLRMRARRLMEKYGRVKPKDWKEVDHKDNNVKNGNISNLRVISREANRKKWAAKANRNRWGS